MKEISSPTTSNWNAILIYLYLSQNIKVDSVHHPHSSFFNPPFSHLIFKSLWTSMCLSCWGHPPTLLPPQGFPGTLMSRHLLPSLIPEHATLFSTGSGCGKEPPPGPFQEDWEPSDSTARLPLCPQRSRAVVFSCRYFLTRNSPSHFTHISR